MIRTETEPRCSKGRKTHSWLDPHTTLEQDGVTVRIERCARCGVERVTCTERRFALPLALLCPQLGEAQEG